MSSAYISYLSLKPNV